MIQLSKLQYTCTEEEKSMLGQVLLFFFLSTALRRGLLARVRIAGLFELLRDVDAREPTCPRSFRRPGAFGLVEPDIRPSRDFRSARSLKARFKKKREIDIPLKNLKRIESRLRCFLSFSLFTQVGNTCTCLSIPISNKPNSLKKKKSYNEF